MAHEYERKYEVWVIDHGHNDNHAEWVGDAENIMDVQRLINKALRNYPIFTSDEIVIHTVYSEEDGGGKNGESHMFEKPEKPEVPEGMVLVPEYEHKMIQHMLNRDKGGMPKGKTQYLITVEEV